MTFAEILPGLLDKKRHRRKVWQPEEDCGFTRGNYLTRFFLGRKSEQLNWFDFAATDWEEVKDERD